MSKEEKVRKLLAEIKASAKAPTERAARLHEERRRIRVLKQRKEFL